MNRKSMNGWLLTILFFLATSFVIQAQDMNRTRLDYYQRGSHRNILQIPDIEGYVTLKGDFHSHTVFSDGRVWPEIRVYEAWREGLDIIAISDHLERQRHGDYVKGDRNTSADVIENLARSRNIILVRGTEITRRMPPGHFNALFVEDANPINNEDFMKEFEEAIRQGAFVQWNHPGWDSQQPDTTLWWEEHTTLLEKGWLHGIEVVNGTHWYPVALDWCLDKGLTVIGTSDIHTPIDFQYDLSLPGSHRPMTLVFAKERSHDAVKEALFAGNTLAFIGDQLMGKEALLLSLVEASVTVHPPYHSRDRDGNTIVYRELENKSDLTFILEKTGPEDEGETIELPPRSVMILDHPENTAEMKFQIINCWSGGREHPVLTMDL